MRYRRPSLRTLLGLTAAEKNLKRSLGVYEVTRVLNAPQNARRRVKRALGWESGPARFLRFLFRLGR